MYAICIAEGHHDAHANVPTNTLSLKDKEQVIEYVITTGEQTWIDFNQSWTTCTQTYMRQHSLRKMRLCDLRVDTLHGPVQEGLNTTILSMILQPFQHKDDTAAANNNNNRNGSNQRRRRVPTVYKKQVVGMYRHRNFRMCSTSHIAIGLFMRLWNNFTISFIDNRDGRPPTWQTFKLIQDWGTERAVYNYYKGILGDLGLDPNKVTHLRSGSMEQGSA